MREFSGPMPDRINALPRDVRGFPIPYFVAYLDGRPCFPVMDPDKMRHCMTHSRCWICGDRITAFKTFVIGPMCCINRVSAEPPSHLECARFAVRNCPFMAHPEAKRSKLDQSQFDKPGGVMIERNPGTTCLWTSKRFAIEMDHGKPLWRIGPAEHVEFYARGRKASRAEVDHSVKTGLPLLQRVAAAEGALPMLADQVEAFRTLLDAQGWPDPPDLPDIDLRALYAEAGP